MPDTEEWITVQEAAGISGYSEQYLRRLIRQGEIKARKFGTIWQVDRSSLTVYLKRAGKSEDRRYGPRIG
jgi:excisionase family DNA binding protein